MPRGANLAAYKVKPGEIRNPTGKNGSENRNPIQKALKEELLKGTNLKLIVEEVVKKARRDPRWFAELRDTVEGKPKQRVEVTGDEGGPISIADAQLPATIVALLERARNLALESRRPTSVIDVTPAGDSKT